MIFLALKGSTTTVLPPVFNGAGSKFTHPHATTPKKSLSNYAGIHKSHPHLGEMNGSRYSDPRGKGMTSYLGRMDDGRPDLHPSGPTCMTNRFHCDACLPIVR